MRIILSSISLLCFISTPSAISIHSHSHSHSQERVEDGAFSPKVNDPKLKKSESELIHEVMLGSAKEAEEFDHLPAEESKKRLLLLLSKIDVDNSKFIDAKELFEWIVKSFKKLSDEEATERFQDADANKDGKISWQEQLSDSFGNENDLDESSVEDELLLKADKKLFQAADLNHDGFLDQMEYKRFSNPEDFADMLPILLANTLDEKDLNKDGLISFEEFVGNKDKLTDRSWVISERENFEANYDKNKDGYLNNEEIILWIVPNSTQVAVEETRYLMATADDDHDELLSFDEILSNHDVFVGSEATDFGEHLQNIHSIMDEL